MSLKEYQRKRKFSQTPEPKGKKQSTKGELRFVVQKHDATRTHFDFRLELDGTFKSWAIPKGPSLNPLDQRLAVRVEDHPLEYGSFEGIIPKGNYGAGTVMIWDSGTYRDRHQLETKRSEKTLREGLAKGRLVLWLDGERLKGEFALIQLKGRDPKAWLLIKKRDQFAKYKDQALPEKSVKTGRAMEKISAESEKKKDVWHSRAVRTSGPRRTASLKKFVPRRHPGTNSPVLTNLDKVFWPEEGYTKGDLIEYYRTVAPLLLPHLKDRPESLNRFPNGIRGKSFFHKDMVGIPSWVPTVRVQSGSSDKTINYALCQDEPTLLFLINLGCIELNPWLSRVQSLDRPDFLVLDLDPDDNPFSEVMEVAKGAHAILKKIGVEAFCKTSGATGLHIAIPLGARYDYDVAREFCEKLARAVHSEFPEITSMERNPARRRGKIYLDFLQNRRSQTLASAYCVRPRPGATVSTPLKWTELKRGLSPENFSIKTAPKRFKKVGDLWAPVLGGTTDLAASEKKLARLCG